MRNATSLLLVALLVALSGSLARTATAQDPVEGIDFIWIDLGKKNEGVLLEQKDQLDGVTKPDRVKGVDCRENPWPYAGPGNNHMYFNVDDTFLKGGNTEVWIVMEYFDSVDSQQIDLEYDSNGAGPVGGAFRGANDGAFPILKPEGTDTWRIHVWHLKDARFENRGNGMDFRFSSHGQGPIWINRVWVSLVEPPDPFDPELPFGKPRSVSPQGKIATTWATIKRSR